MRPNVQSAWLGFTRGFEGDTNFMYTDAEGFVTTGYGNLIDPESFAVALPWQNKDGSLATPAEVQQEWNTVKNGGAAFRSFAAQSGTQLRLAADAVAELFNQKTATNETAIRQIIPNYDNLPADAQLALLSMVWAMGSGGLASFKGLVSAINKNPPDFATAAAQSHMQGVGIDTRNAADKLLFSNADAVITKKLDPATLYYPQDASSYTPGLSDIFGTTQGLLTSQNILLLGAVGLFVYGLHTGKLRRGLRKAGVFVPTSWRRKIPSLPSPA